MNLAVAYSELLCVVFFDACNISRRRHSISTPTKMKAAFAAVEAKVEAAATTESDYDATKPVVTLKC
jgi:hypothetical protein